MRLQAEHGMVDHPRWAARARPRRALLDVVRRATCPHFPIKLISKQSNATQLSSAQLLFRLAFRIRFIRMSAASLLSAYAAPLLTPFTRSCCSSVSSTSSSIAFSSASGRGRSSTHGPTKTHRREYEIAAEEYQPIHARLQKLTGSEMQKLFGQLDAAGVPWTAGRPVPPLKK